MSVESIKHRWKLLHKIFREEKDTVYSDVRIIDYREGHMGLKHANEIQRDLPINKRKKQLENWKLAEELLFKRIEESQKEGETNCICIEDISQTTIDKLKALDYVIETDDWDIYYIDWGQDRHKKSWFGWYDPAKGQPRC